MIREAQYQNDTNSKPNSLRLLESHPMPMHAQKSVPCSDCPIFSFGPNAAVLQ